MVTKKREVTKHDKSFATSQKLQNEYRNTLKAFYSVMKTQDRYIRFGFLTGVTKFGKVSVFSDLNNLKYLVPYYMPIKDSESVY